MDMVTLYSVFGTRPGLVHFGIFYTLYILYYLG